MLKYKKTLVLLAVTMVAAFYLFWPGFKPDLSATPSLYMKVSASFGTDQGRGNVVGIEPYMEPLDYATPARFEAKLAGYLEIAAHQGWIGENTIVLLPEHIGTWLLAMGQKSRVYEAKDTSAAMLPIMSHNLVGMVKNLFIFDDESQWEAALIRTRTPEVAAALYDVYSSLAKRFGVTLVTGSSAIMTPGIYPDTLSYGHGPIFNASFVFTPDGKPIEDAVRKVHPVPSEIGFTKASKAEFLPTFPVAGRTLGVLVCADSWFEDTTAYLAGSGVDLLLVPSFLTGTTWDAPWQGYQGDMPQTHGWQSDVGSITEGEAWIKYALPAKAAKHNIRFGMNVFLKGNMWGQKGAGRALIWQDGTLHVGRGGDDGAALYNLWLD
ncbi:nitrilase-related carbon-nitrogen hydrolase [Kordiimonas gwangyangensis]|uniref:nitrilase-related carbon-nitrogen hydrolase n=1 Tax=Kordiimonas gwangyangensis TaxID=288022 RepID=UPI0003A5C44C|nr:nitrilase-related carbon-nitrogen hydrolase [Kordiimonas gwangyangensis]